MLAGGASSPPAPAEPAWGPSGAELATARAEVAGWDAAHLAGQVIIGRYHGTDPASAATLVRRYHLAGVCMTGGNIASAAQVRASAAAIHAAVRADGRDYPAVIGVDQEGGTTAHLGPHATELPSFMSAGAAVAGATTRGDGSRGEQAVAAAARATALELRGLGFTWVFAPVADVTIGPADPTIGTRSPSGDPETAATATAAAIRGFRDGALIPTAKHYPGHGSVTDDSHRALPVQAADLAALRARDLKPFVAAVRAGAPAVMMSHLAVTALDPGVPTSLSAAGYASLKQETGFEGVAVTDSLGMGAVRRGGDPSVRALAAGADLVLMPADTAAAHAAIVAALADGTVARPRIEDAAAKVVALQRWQARRAAATPVPGDAARTAAAASQGVVGGGADPGVGAVSGAAAARRPGGRRNPAGPGALRRRRARRRPPPGVGADAGPGDVDPGERRAGGGPELADGARPIAGTGWPLRALRANPGCLRGAGCGAHRPGRGDRRPPGPRARRRRHGLLTRSAAGRPIRRRRPPPGHGLPAWRHTCSGRRGSGSPPASCAPGRW